MPIPLREASRRRCGAKAATIAVLWREGLPVPDGFVVPFDEPTGVGDSAPPVLTGPFREAVARAIEDLGDPVLAVRSSAADEDAEGASAAGQYTTSLGVRGVVAVCEAVIACRASARAPRAIEYRRRRAGDSARTTPDLAVLIQPLIAADVSGVMFTPGQAGEPTHIEAAWGLGPSVVDGRVTPDRYRVWPDGTVRLSAGRKETRIDPGPEGAGLVHRPVDERLAGAPTLAAEHVRSLAELGSRIAALLGGPQDIEWAIEDGRIWILQARPITASLPPATAVTPTGTDRLLTGVPGSRGAITARARLVRGPSDFGRVLPGDILVCPHTDPGWTPLFTIAGGVVAETGGVLSHAAIVAREYGIPAVLGVAGALQLIHDGDLITLDGTAGTVTPA